MRKKNELNQQKFLRSKKCFEPSKKIDQTNYFEKLALPKTRHLNHHRRIATNPSFFSPMNSPTVKEKDTLSTKILTSPQNCISPKQSQSLFRPRFQSFAAQSQNSPGGMVFDPKASFATLARPQSTKPSFKRQIMNGRPESSSNNTIALSEATKEKQNHPKHRFSMMDSSKEVKLEDLKQSSPKSPKLRVSIFETYKNQNHASRESIDTKQIEKKFKVIMMRRREKRKIIQSFDKFFEKCDLEAVLQNDETKTLDEEFKKFGREYDKMQYNANKKMERNDLHGSENKFNQMRNQIRFKKKIIDHLLENVGDKQDLLSMYNKHVTMENNINKSKQIIMEQN